MDLDVSYAPHDFDRRYRLAAGALDSARDVEAIGRLVTAARKHVEAGGHIIERGTGWSRGGRVGLLASSMNPLTRAHVALAEAARRSGALDALFWVATLVTVDKERVERATLVDRLVQAQEHARASGDGLLLLSGGLYVEQARAAHALLGPEVEIALIVGYDKIVQIFDPRYYSDRDAALDELFLEADVIVGPREGAGEVELRALLDTPGNRMFASRVSYCPLPDRYATDSSTEARTLAARGETGAPLRDLLTPEGLALTLVTDPYAQMLPPSASLLGDRYTARQTILEALNRLTGRDLLQAPKISELVTWSAEDSLRGAALRAWALSLKAGGVDGLRAALAAG